MAASPGEVLAASARRRICTGCSPLPATITPMQSMIPVFATCTACGGRSGNRSAAAKSPSALANDLDMASMGEGTVAEHTRDFVIIVDKASRRDWFSDRHKDVILLVRFSLELDARVPD